MTIAEQYIEWCLSRVFTCDRVCWLTDYAIRLFSYPIYQRKGETG